MALDGLLMHRIIAELQTEVPTKIHKIYNLSENEVLFNLRSAKNRKNLLVSLHSVYNRIQFSDRTYTTPEEPSHFVMLLRKQCEDGWISELRQLGLDRVVKMTVVKRDDLGDNTTHTIYIELMGKYANLILVDDTGKIVDALKRIPPFENTKRTIQPGAMYSDPDVQDKRDPLISDDFDPTLSFTQQFHGISPLLSREIQYRINHHETFRQVMDLIRDSKYLYLSEVEGETQFHCLPLTHLEVPYKQYPLMQGLDELFFQKEERERIRQHTGDLFKFVQREIKKYAQKLPKLKEAMDEALDCEKWRTLGDYLYSFGMKVEKGNTQIEVPAYDGSGMILIPLDSKLDGKGNAKKYFQKYNKGKKGQEHLIKQIRICEDEIDYFEGLKEQLEIAGINDAIEIRQELADAGILKAMPSKIRRKKKSLPQYLSFTLDNGIRIHVGKNNLQNEFITFKLAKRNDTWFHVKDHHGAHVVVESEQLDEPTLRTAAQLAAYYSKARTSSSVPVDYCRVGNLKKIPGAKPGMVSLSSHKTIYIDPDESFIQNLLSKNRTPS
jgi:predicted ribosome quality control (RQC) complex YloA/Tae2 family protein